jgi:putative two-component system response regulator
MSYDEAFEIIRQELGHHFDPHLGRIFISLKDEIIRLYESFENTDYAR